MSESGGNSKHSIWVAVISAGGVVLAAVIGLFAGVVEVPILSGAPASSDLQVTVRELEGKITQLEQDNQQLSESLAEATSGASAGPSAPASVEFRRATATDEPVMLNAYTCLDLDSEAPNWDANDEYEGDLCINSGQLEGDNLTVFEEEPDKAACEARTDVKDTRDAETLLNKYVCLDSDSGYTARLHVVGVDENDSGSTTITFDIGVWE